MAQRQGETREIFCTRRTAEIRTKATRNKVEVTNRIDNKCIASRHVQYDLPPPQAIQPEMSMPVRRFEFEI